MNNTTFEMNDWMLKNERSRFIVAGSTHVVCATFSVEAPYAEFWFENGKWHFLRCLFQIPTNLPNQAKGETK